MEAHDIHLLLQILDDAGIPNCLVGEFALNYYNSPRTLHDLEICVPQADLAHAASKFASSDLLVAAAEKDYNLYTEHKRGLPSFRWRQELFLHVLLCPCESMFLDPLQGSIIPPAEHHDHAEYSHEIADIISTDEMYKLPLPRLAPFFQGLCRKYCHAGDSMSAIAAEQLVDGMDLDIVWCRRHMSPDQADELEFALRLVAGKDSRIADFSLNSVTCFIPSKEEAQRLLQIPGRD